MYSLLLASAILTLAALASCETDSFDDVPDTEQQAAIYLLSIAPTRETALERCIQAETVALSCVSDGGRQSEYLTTVNTNYRPVSTSSNATTLCNSLIDAGVFNSPTVFTYGARQCHFECNRRYWQTRRDGGLCTSSGTQSGIFAHAQCSPSRWQSDCQDSTFQSCLRDCFVNGTDTYFLPQGY